MKFSAALLCTSTLLSMTLLIGCDAYDERLVQQGSSLLIAGSSAAPAVPTSTVSVPPPIKAVETRCGDGIISGPERCDVGIELGSGACPTECPPLAACALRGLNGTACQAECVLLELSCGADDGCCPAGCMAGSDRDCSTACGDGKIETELGETCEPGSATPCMDSDQACADADPCTLDKLTGSPKNCNAVCTHEPITERVAADGCCPSLANAVQDSDCKPVCGNGVREPGELCDGGEGCDSDCTLTATATERETCLDGFAKTDCQRCSCEKCTVPYLACRTGTSASANRLCGAVIDCGEQARCIGSACFCGDGLTCALPFGPCRAEITAAAGVGDPLLISIMGNDPMTTLGRASTVGMCRASQCAAACMISAK